MPVLQRLTMSAWIPSMGVSGAAGRLTKRVAVGSNGRGARAARGGARRRLAAGVDSARWIHTDPPNPGDLLAVTCRRDSRPACGERPGHGGWPRSHLVVLSTR